MPGFILNAKGEKQAALELMMNILSSSGEQLDPSEVNHTIYYICKQILSSSEAKRVAFCKK